MSDYEVESESFEGEGTAFKATHKETGVQVVIEKISKSDIPEKDLLKSTAYTLFVHKHLSHPNLVKVFDILESQTEIFLITEPLSEKTLSEYADEKKLELREGRPIDEQEVLQVIKPVLEATNYLHQNGISFGIYSMDRIKFDPFGQPKIMVDDFIVPYKSKELINKMQGVPYLMPAEICKDLWYDPEKSDCYTIAVMIFKILTGRYPFEAPSIMALAQAVEQGDFEISEGVSEQARDFFERTILPNPDERLNFSEILEHPWFEILRETMKIEERVLEEETLKLLSEKYGVAEEEIQETIQEHPGSRLKIEYELSKEKLRCERLKAKSEEIIEKTSIEIEIQNRTF